ncbi:hypothetical protein CHUAL_003622 [Chamberlinius hualienensis]
MVHYAACLLFFILTSNSIEADHVPSKILLRHLSSPKRSNDSTVYECYFSNDVQQCFWITDDGSDPLESEFSYIDGLNGKNTKNCTIKFLKHSITKNYGEQVSLSCVGQKNCRWLRGKMFMDDQLFSRKSDGCSIEFNISTTEYYGYYRCVDMNEYNVLAVYYLWNVISNSTKGTDDNKNSGEFCSTAICESNNYISWIVAIVITLIVNIAIISALVFLYRRKVLVLHEQIGTYENVELSNIVQPDKKSFESEYEEETYITLDEQLPDETTVDATETRTTTTGEDDDDGYLTPADINQFGIIRDTASVYYENLEFH